MNPFTRQAITIRGRPGSSRFWEVEQHAASLLLCSSDATGRLKRSKKECGDEDEARFAMGALIAKKVRAGFTEVGPSVELTPATPARPPGSAVLVDEYYASGDERFLDEVLHFEGPQKLAAMAEPWYRDGRPFARKMLLAYVDDGCDRREHKALVKRIFKLAEKAGDDEVMAHFVVAFDRLARRALVRIGANWNAALRQAEPVMGLRPDPAVPARLKKDAEGKRAPSVRFSRSTRTYLARRAFRYFRRLGRTDIGRYGLAMRAAMPLYRDEDLSTAARLLDAWGLMHALYGFSPVLQKSPKGLRIKEGRSLAELEPAPYFPAAWEHAFDDLVVMLAQARSRTVRQWTIAVLRKNYAADLGGLAFKHVKMLLASRHDEVARLGAELLPGLKELDTLPIREWLDLLRIENLDVVAFVCEAVKRHVAPARVALEQCVELASARAAPVAELGLAWVREKSVRGEGDLRTVLRLRSAGVPAVRVEASRWCGSLLKTLPFARVEDVRELCDAPFADARAEGLTCLGEVERFKRDAGLWFALTESPYDDVRAFVARHAKLWKDEAAPSTLVHFWSGALLAVHTGGLAKRRVPRDIAGRIAAHPEEADALLPVLGFALRSVRTTDRALALAALARAVLRDPALRQLARKHLPELVFTEQVTA